MKDTRSELGRLGERLAADYLRRHGYSIRETNYRCPVGEMDIVATEGECLVFVEVRTRRGRGLGLPEESITPAKQAKLVEVAQTYLQERGEAAADWRIDVVAVELTPGGRLRRIGLIKNAVGGESEL